MSEAPDPERPGARRNLDQALGGAEEPQAKKTKARRQWSGKMPDTRTPIRPSTGSKTPIRQRGDAKEPRNEQVIMEIDNKVEDITEHMNAMKITIKHMHDKLEQCCDDQFAFRKQQLWSLQAQVREQREKAGKEECMVGWPSAATASQRSQFVLWCLQQAGLEPSSCDISHSVRYQQLSPMTVLTFRLSSMRVQFDKWYKEEFINKKKPLHFYADGHAYTDTIKLRPQIALWDRIKGEPLKICLKAMDLANRSGQSQICMEKVKPWWNHNAIYDDYQTLAWVFFSVRDVQATVYLDQSVYKSVAEHWNEAAQAVKNGPQGVDANSSQNVKGKGYGKGKGKAFDTKQGEFPFELKLAEVTDWHYDREVRARQEEAELNDM